MPTNRISFTGFGIHVSHCLASGIAVPVASSCGILLLISSSAATVAARSKVGYDTSSQIELLPMRTGKFDSAPLLDKDGFRAGVPHEMTAESERVSLFFLLSHRICSSRYMLLPFYIYYARVLNSIHIFLTLSLLLFALQKLTESSRNHQFWPFPTPHPAPPSLTSTVCRTLSVRQTLNVVSHQQLLKHALQNGVQMNLWKRK